MATGVRMSRTVLALLALAVWLAATLAFRPLALPDEGRYAGVAWEMLRSGRWLEPTLDGLPFLHKPPLWYWLSAASMTVFGVHPWAARLPSLAGAVLAGAALFLFVRRWIGTATANTALIVYATLPLVYGGAQYANHDMLLAGFVATSLLLAAHAALAREAGDAHRAALALAYACAGLGVMTKGLVAAVLPALAFAAWCVASRRTRSIAFLAWPPGWALLLLITVPWIAAMQSRHTGFLHYFFVVQQFSRYTGSGFNNPQGPWFYPVVLTVLGLPWTVWLWRIAGRRFFEAVPGESRRDVRLLMAVWLVVAVVFFSLPRSKLVGYILVAAPPFAFLAAAGFDAAWRAPAGRWIRFMPGLRSLAGLSALVCVSAVSGVALFGSSSGRTAVAAWRTTIAPGDRVVMVDDYDYDLPFYLQLAQPVEVAAGWSRLLDSDGWRRELRDAASFAPAVARDRLLETSVLPEWLCRPGTTTWVFGDTPALQALGATQIVELARHEAMAVWRVDASSADRCRIATRP
jgi:4-amino-4-deoxy-L-arabinose transferase-like glycosyltransferase